MHSIAVIKAILVALDLCYFRNIMAVVFFWYRQIPVSMKDLLSIFRIWWKRCLDVKSILAKLILVGKCVNVFIWDKEYSKGYILWMSTAIVIKIKLTLGNSKASKNLSRFLKSDNSYRIKDCWKSFTNVKYVFKVCSTWKFFQEIFSF